MEERWVSATSTMLAILGVLLLAYLLFGVLGLGGFEAAGPGSGDGDEPGDEEPGDGDPVEGDEETGFEVGEDDVDDGEDVEGDGKPTGEPGFSALSPTNRTSFRTASFDRYDGDRWTKTDEPVADPDYVYDRLDEANVSAAENHTNFRAEGSVVALPNRGVSRGGVMVGEGMVAFESGDLVPYRPLQPGEGLSIGGVGGGSTVIGDGTAYANTSEVLATRYTDLPRDLDTAVYGLADALTENSTSRYSVTEDVIVWLNRNRGYSTEAEADCSGTSPELPDDVEPPTSTSGFVEEFLFCMEEGHEMHFASAAAVLLRTQDVPVRYVTGVEEVDGEMTRRTADHWIDVRVDGDWLTVYTTSYVYREGRLQSSGAAVADHDVVYRPVEAEVELPGEVRPGESIEVEVSRDGEPVEDAVVRFDGRTAYHRGSSGVFDAAATVTDSDGFTHATTPYVEDLTVEVVEVDPAPTTLATRHLDLRHSVELDDTLYFTRGSGGGESYSHPTAAETSMPTEASVDHPSKPVPGREVSVTGHVEDVAVDGGVVHVDGEPVDVADSDGVAWYTTPYRNHTVYVERGSVTGYADVTPVLDGELSVEEQPLPLTEFAVGFTVDGQAIPEATVYVDGAEETVTGSEGVANVSAPDAVEFDVSAERGEVRDNVSVDLTGVYEAMEMEVSGYRLPATPLTTTVETEGRPLRNAEVKVDDGNWSDVDEDGSYSFLLPLDLRRSEVEVEARAHGYTAEASVELPLANRLLTALLPLLVGATVFHRYGGFGRLRRLYRRRPNAREALETAGERAKDTMTSVVDGVRIVPTRVTAMVTAATKGLVDGSVQFLYVAAGSLAAAIRLLAALAAATPRALHRLFETAASVAARLPRWTVKAVVAVLLLPVKFVRRCRGRAGERQVETDERGSGDRGGMGFEEFVYAAWRWLAGQVDARSTWTPAEVADTAVERGFPEDAVHRLTRVFRRVRYSGEDPDDPAKREARDAVDKLENRTTPEEDVD